MLTDELKKEIQSCFSQLLTNKNLQSRFGQRQMIAEIANTFTSVSMDEEGIRQDSHPAVAVIEAGTGTGKTIAYMVPAIPIARALNKKLVIATATVALQEQIMFKDIPDLLRSSNMQFSYGLAKGRGRYLCLSKLDNQLRSNTSQLALQDLWGMDTDNAAEPDHALYQRMLDAISGEGWKGDRDDWPEMLDDSQWRHVSVEHGQCSGSRCSYFSNCCFFKSRDNLDKADCIVANHDLVLADLSLGGGVILPAPEDTIYIFDEAHHLPLKSISHFSHTIRLRATGRWLEQMNSVFVRLQKDAGSTSGLEALLEQAVQSCQDTATGVRESLAIFDQFAGKAETQGRGDTSQYVFDGGVVDGGLRELCHDLQLGFSGLSQHLDKVLDVIRNCMESDGAEFDRQQAESWYPVLGSMSTRAKAGERLWYFFARPDESGEAPYARWMTFSPSGADTEVTLSCSPVLAAESLTATLWQEAFAVLMTSATLTAVGSFDFLSMRAGLPEGTRYTRISSPFDFNSAVLLRIPSRGFDPSDTQRHTGAITELLPDILESATGSLVLFSSRRQLQDVLYGLDAGLKADVLSQDDYSKQELIRLHRQNVDEGRRSVIFGLAGLTEGIDLPGIYCTHVVIAKIPFSVPNDPVGSTLGFWVEQQGKNPFREISVPEASMRLIQACGRLVRTEQDRGTITILDERILTRQYGKSILASLPPYRREIFDVALSE